ncbi:MAG TPA: hypothetical protein DCP69_11320 [Candidatus Omnitrophica bacterium]|nr:hypothetical protein [Candidatus Omnitrophota bacterium]
MRTRLEHLPEEHHDVLSILPSKRRGQRRTDQRDSRPVLQSGWFLRRAADDSSQDVKCLPRRQRRLPEP